MKKIFSIMLTLCLALSVSFALPESVSAEETTVTNAMTNLRWADDLTLKWDYNGTVKINGQEVYAAFIEILESKDNVKYTPMNYIYDFLIDEKQETLDIRTDISQQVRDGFSYFKARVGYTLEFNGTAISYVEGDLLDLSGATTYDLPKNLKQTGNTITWDAVPGCSTYTIAVEAYGKPDRLYYKTTASSYGLTDILDYLKTNGFMRADILLIAGDYETEYSKTSTILPSYNSGISLYLDGFRIGDKYVSESNPDIFGDGTASYDLATNTLTLNNATIIPGVTIFSGNMDRTGILALDKDLTIKLIGDSEINFEQSDEVYGWDTGITACNLDIVGPGSLTINLTDRPSAYLDGAFVDGSLTIKDAALNINIGETPRLVSGLSVNYDCTMDNAALNIDSYNNNKADRLEEMLVWRTMQLNNSSVVNINAGDTGNLIETGKLEINSGCFNVNLSKPRSPVMTIGSKDFEYNANYDFNIQYYEPDGLMLSSSDVVSTEAKPTCTEPGTITIKCPLCNEEKTFEIDSPEGHEYTNVITNSATLDDSGRLVPTCDKCGKTKSAIVVPRVASVKIAKSSYTYDGKAKKPAVTVTDGKGNVLTKDVDYKVTYKANTKVGKATVTVSGKGVYSYDKNLTFKINPKGTEISKLTPVSKGIKVSIKKQAVQTTGYQVRYSTSSKMSSAKTVTVKSYKTTSTTVKNLKAKKKYYVQVRTYKTVNGTKYYSSWSKSKNTTTKA